MDVTCERCSTEYEFDETLLSGRGTSVKCTNCGHVFKVYPKAAEEADRVTSSWRLKTTSGFVDSIETLRELQRRISSGELTPDDQIARGDEEWKTLGSIPELETFFRAAGVEVQSPRIPSPLPPAIAPGAQKEAKESSLPPGKRVRQPTLLGVSPVQRVPGAGAGSVAEAAPVAGSVSGAEAATGAASASGAASVSEAEAAPVTPPVAASDSATASVSASAAEAAPVAASASASEPASASASASEGALGLPESLPESLPKVGGSSYQSPYTRDSLADTAAIEPEDAEFEEKASTSVRTSTPPPGYYEDDDDIPELPGRGTSPLRWLLIIVAVGGLALVASQWNRVALLLGIGSDPTLIAASVDQGDAAIAEASPSAYANAIEAYGRAIEAGGNNDVIVLAKLSNAYALAAQARIDGGASAESVANLAEGALSTAEAARSLDSRALEVKLAHVDALRLLGDDGRAREQLEDARAMSFSRTAEFYRIDARLSAAEAEGRLENGLRSARQAAELDPDGVRYALLLARAEQASGHEEEAREALDAILEAHPGHPVATELIAGMDEEAGAGTVAEPAAAAGTVAEPAAVAEPGTAAAAEASAAAEPAAAPVPVAAEPVVEEKAAAPKAVAPKAEAPEAVAAPKPKPKPARPKAPAREPELDEYDRLAKAAGSDAFVDGRPPVLDYESNMKKGREELEAGNYARARAYFDSALEVHPGSADAMDALGDVATAVNDYASALRYYRVAAQRGHPDGYFNLGKTYEQLGKNEEAVSAYYTYVKRRPTGTHASAARTAIRTLEPRAKLPPEPEPEPPATEAPAEAPDPATP